MADTNGAKEQVRAQAEEAARRAESELKELRRELRKRAEGVRIEVVKQLHKAAETLRREVRDRKADEEAIANADKLAKGLEKAANYLNTHNIDQMGEEATRAVRNNPWRSVAMVFIVGLLVGLFLRRE